MGGGRGGRERRGGRGREGRGVEAMGRNGRGRAVVATMRIRGWTDDIRGPGLGLWVTV